MLARFSDQFFDPSGSNRREVEQLLSMVQVEVLNALCGHRSAIQQNGLAEWMPTVSLPASGRTAKELVADLRGLLQRCMNPASPNWAGHMDTSASVAGVAGELASAAINNNMLSVEMSPAFSRLEHAMLLEVCRWFGLGERAGGVMLSGGTLANLQALTVARNHVLRCQEKGISASGNAIVLASEVAHTSIQKACMVLGMGTRAVAKVSVDAESRMRVDDLVYKIDTFRSQGATPVCVVATAGTTTTGSIDPLLQIAEICAERGVWLHVDAAHAGALTLSRQHRCLIDGVQYADSLTFNPQKWLYVPKTCAMVLFKDASVWQSAFRVASPYMKDGGELVNLTEVSIQGTRHAEILKMWLSLQHIGAELHETLIDHSMELATSLAQRLQANPAVELIGSPQTNIVCFRVRAPDEAQRDERTIKVHSYLLERAGVFCSLPDYAGGKIIRVVLLNPYTDLRFVDCLAARVDEALTMFGWRIDKEN